MRRFILFLVRLRFGLKKYEKFQFVNQKSDAFYYFTEINVMKHISGWTHPSNVSLNWLLDNECKIRRVEDDT